MKGLALLICIGSVVSLFGINQKSKSTGQGCSDSGITDDDWLQRISPLAILEYEKIVTNTTQTRVQWETALQKWAKKYGVEDKYKAQLDEYERNHVEFEQSIADLIAPLTAYLKKYTRIGHNETQSIDSIFDEAQALFMTLDEKQKAVADFIIETYSMEIEGNPGNNAGFKGFIGRFSAINGSLSTNTTRYTDSDSTFSSENQTSFD